MGLKKILRENKYTKDFYWQIHDNFYKKKYIKNNLQGKYKFINRSKGSDVLCIVLAGYKNYLIPAVLGRLKKFAPEVIDVCIITSGKWSDELNTICEKNNWSYLSTVRNNISLSQNIAINLHTSAKYIFKMDEDVFITNNYFEKMMEAYKKCSDSTYYNPGVMAPILPINGYGHVKIIREFGLEEFYKKRFGTLKIASGPDRKIESDSQLAKFMWGESIVENGIEYCVPSIDEMNEIMGKRDLEIVACPVRFSIGAILFERTLWEDMHYFTVGEGTDLGSDEVQLCKYCMIKSKPLMICSNAVVGHFSFKDQNRIMEEYYNDNKDKFII